MKKLLLGIMAIQVCCMIAGVGFLGNGQGISGLFNINFNLFFIIYNAHSLSKLKP